MRKLNAFLAGLLTLSGTLSASTVSFTLNIPKYAEGLMMNISENGDYRDNVPLANGENNFELAEGSSFNIQGTTPYQISKVTNKAGTTVSTGNYWYMYPNSSDDGQVYTIDVINLDDARTASCTVNVDDASRVSATLSGTSTRVSLQNGTQTLRFDPENENILYVSSSDYYLPLYSVKVDDAVVPLESGQHAVPLTNGCNVDIIAKIPEVPVTVTFNINETGEGCVTDVKVDDEAVTDFDGHELTMTAGHRLSFTVPSTFSLDSFSINGESTYYSGGYAYSMTVTANTTIDIEAHRYATYKCKVMVTDPTHIRLYAGRSTYGTPIQLSGPVSDIEVPENDAYLAWKAADGCKINDVTADGIPVTYDYIEVTDGMTLSFNTAEIVMDKTAVFWIDNKEALDDGSYSYLTLMANTANYDRVDLSSALQTGYSLIPFYDGYTSFGLGWYTTNNVVGKVYLNGTEQEAMWGQYTFSPLNDGDVVKVFLSNEPEECHVSFTVDEGIDATVVRDIISNVGNWREGFTTFAGTQVNIAPVQGVGLAVKVNGVEVPEDNDAGSHQFVVVEPRTEVAISKAGTDGIATVGAENADAQVYNLQGVKVGSSKDLNRLPAGIYIVNGRKLIVK